MLRELPKLGVPQPGQDLYLYLSASEWAVAAVLIMEEGRKEIPVYYTGKILTSSEARYTNIEKILFSLVIASRKLRPYFQSHRIFVRTNWPLKQITNSPGASGRMISWTVELTQFEIHYVPRTAIKAQALADFITEANFSTKEERKVLYKVWVDGARCKTGSGVGVVIQNPDGRKVNYSIRLEFPITNNEAEYEALIQGLEIATALGATGFFFTYKTSFYCLFPHM